MVAGYSAGSSTQVERSVLDSCAKAARARSVVPLRFVLGMLAACESYLDLGQAQLVEAQPSIEEAVGPLCVQYCDAVMSYCAGEFQVYANSLQCLSLCSVMAEGQPEEDRGNSVYCRLTHALRARDTAEPMSHCPQAGPGGAAALSDAPSCATSCEGLCSQMLSICPEQYASLNGCLEDCGGVPDLGGYNIGIGQGNNVQCRLFHLAAAAAAPDPHCSHSAGATPCR